MIQFQRKRVGLVLSVACVMAAFKAAEAQQPRTRSMTYDPDRKEWVELPPPPAGTAAGDLHRIRIQIRDGKFRGALRAIKRLVKRYGPDDQLYPDALIARADALIGRRELAKAYSVLQEFAGKFGGIALTSEALRLQFVIAETYLSGVKRKVMGLRLLSGIDAAYKILDEISSQHPDTRFAELAIKTKADHLFQQSEHALAELEYSRLLREYPQGQYTRFASRRTADAALASCRGVEYDDAALIEAEERYRDYQLRYPGAGDRNEIGRLIDTIHENRAEKELSIGAYYERTEHLSSAVFYYQSVRENWPDTSAAAKATNRLELLGALAPVASASGMANR